MNVKAKLASALLTTLLLASCGGGMSGTYVDSSGQPAMTFSSGKAEIDLGAGGIQEMKYSVDGNKIVLHSPEGDLVLTRQSDGSLVTPWGTWKKK